MLLLTRLVLLCFEQDALKTLPNYPNYSGHPAYSYGQGQAYPMPHSQPSGPSSPHPHHSSFRHYNLSSLAMPYTPDGCTSEENDCLSPTQSRRKAQNRAAYVLSLHRRIVASPMCFCCFAPKLPAYPDVE